MCLGRRARVRRYACALLACLLARMLLAARHTTHTERAARQLDATDCVEDPDKPAQILLRAWDMQVLRCGVVLPAAALGGACPPRADRRQAASLDAVGLAGRRASLTPPQMETIMTHAASLPGTLQKRQSVCVSVRAVG